MSIKVTTQYARSGRNAHAYLQDAIVLIKNQHAESETYEHPYKIVIKDGEVREVHKQCLTAKTKVITRYGKDEKSYIDGKLVRTFDLREAAKQDRLSKKANEVAEGKLGEFDGTLKKFYQGRSLVKEQFVYANGVQAYSVYRGIKKGTVLYPDGKVWCEFKSESILNFCQRSSSHGWIGRIFFSDEHIKNTPSTLPTFERQPTPDRSRWDKTDDFMCPFMGSRNWSMTVYGQEGQVKITAQMVNNQRSGVWLFEGTNTYYLNGVPTTERVYSTPPEQLNSQEIMDIDNVQLRTALDAKKGYERILQDLKGTLVHKDGEYELYSLPIRNHQLLAGRATGDSEIKLLKVKCPSTGTFYTLRVPPDVMTVDSARQWTFGYDVRRENDQVVQNAIELLQET